MPDAVEWPIVCPACRTPLSNKAAAKAHLVDGPCRETIQQMMRGLRWWMASTGIDDALRFAKG